MTVLLAALAACWLERTTGEPEPLDPRFYEDVERRMGQPGTGGGGQIPFADHDGPFVTVSGEVVSEREGAVDLDVRVPDPSKPGGVDPKGKLLLDGPGPFSVEVPAGLGALELQAFQDLAADGPTAEDPFGQVRLDVGADDISGVRIELEVGARPGGPVHVEMPPGAPGGGEAPDQPPAPPPNPMAPFADHDGPTVTISGNLVYDEPGVTVDLDLFQPDEDAPGGRRMLGKLRRPPGPWSLEVPAGFGPLILEAFIDREGDGPDADDPMGAWEGNPLEVGDDDIDGIDIVLRVRADGRMPGRPPPRAARRPRGI